MAKKAGVSTSVLRKWRSGQSEPTRTNLIKLAKAANVPVGWLAAGEGAPDASTTPRGHNQADLDLLEGVASATFEELQSRGLRLESGTQARLLRVLYWHFAHRKEQPDHQTVSNIIDLAAEC